jgi:predicted GH43/DUF377 family glycosyl hydrolase
MVGRIGYVDLHPEDPRRILGVKDTPVLGAGALGCFDDNGVNVTSIIRVADELWLYYFGYQLHQRTRYSLFAGLAISTDEGESFQRKSETPILERSDRERFVRSAPFVLRERGAFRMWYVSGNAWVDVGGKQLPHYGLRYATSGDGIEWPSSGTEVFSPEGEDEHGFGRPFVVKHEHGFRLWYSLRSRSKGYRIGLATSLDGLTWTREDQEVELDVSPNGWDSEIVCYASEVTMNGNTYLFYNGNGYGRDGFGVAIRES